MRVPAVIGLAASDQSRELLRDPAWDGNQYRKWDWLPACRLNNDKLEAYRTYLSATFTKPERVSKPERRRVSKA